MFFPIYVNQVEGTVWGSYDMNSVNTGMRMFHDSPGSRMEQRTQDGDYPSHTFFWRQLRVKYYDNTDARHMGVSENVG